MFMPEFDTDIASKRNVPPGRSCYSCEPGNYTNVSASEQCKQCEPGMYQSEWGATFCKQVRSGYFQNEYAATGEKECKEDHYQSLSGQNECVPCENHTSTKGLLGSSNRTDCRCETGFFARYARVGEKCMPCPSRMTCENERESGHAHSHETSAVSPVSAEGAYSIRVRLSVSSASSTDPCISDGGAGTSCLMSFKCPKARCQQRCTPPCSELYPLIDNVPIASFEAWADVQSDTFTNPLVNCTDPYVKGFMCAACMNGYFKFGSSCIRCPGVFEGSPALSIVMLVAFFLLWFPTIRKLCTVFPKMQIIIPFFQILVVLTNMELEWKIWGRIFAVFSVFNFNIDLTLQSCNMKMSFGTKWLMYVMTPQVWLLAHLFRHGAVLGLTKVCGKPNDDELGQWRNSLGGIFDQFMFILKATWIPCTSNMLLIFSCERFEEPMADYQYLRAAPSLLCWRGQHLALVVVGSMCAIFYILLVPGFFAWQLMYKGANGVRIDLACFVRR